MAENELLRFFRKYVFPLSGISRGFSEKLIAGIDYLGIFLYITTVSEYIFKLMFMICRHFPKKHQRWLRATQ